MRLAIALLLLAPPALAGTNDAWVDAIAGDDASGLGTELAPWRTLTHAIAETSGATTIHVAPGRYDAALGESYPLFLRQGMSLLGSGAHHTILTGGGSGTLVELAKSTLVSDLTLQRADRGVNSLGFGFEGAGSVRYLRRCVIRDCAVGVWVEDQIHTDHGVAIVSSSITGNGIGVKGFSTDNDFQSITVQLFGSTLVGNLVGTEYDGFGERWLGVVGSVVRGNEDDSLASWVNYYPGVSDSVLGDATFVGVNGNVGFDPQLVQASAGDVHLATTSAAIDLFAAPPFWPPEAVYVGPSWLWEPSYAEVGDLDGGPRQVGGGFDPGADEHALLSLWAFGTPQLGASFDLRGQGEPGDVFLNVLGFDVYETPLLGFVWLEGPAFFMGATLLDADGISAFPVALPADPTLTGIDAWWQAFTITDTFYDGTNPVRTRLLP